jgi:hypothetical protein
MGLYKRRILVHGAPVDTTLVCPFDGLSNLSYPVYLNSVNGSGLPQPRGPIGDDSLVHVSGITRPAWNADPTGYFRAAPSGLARTYTRAYANGTDGFGKDTYTAFSEVNWYQNYWACPSGHHFIFPSGLSSDMPGGAAQGNVSDTVPPAFGNFE